MQQACLSQWIARNQTQCGEVQALARGLSSRDMHWNPTEGGWSIAQVLDHLNITARQYGPALQKSIALQKPQASEFRPGWMSRKLLHMVSAANQGRLKAPKSFQPPPAPETDGVEDFMLLQEELVQCMQAADGVDLNRSKLRSPALPILRLSLGVAFDLLGLHTDRHLKQAQRVRAHADFPGPAAE